MKKMLVAVFLALCTFLPLMCFADPADPLTSVEVYAVFSTSYPDGEFIDPTITIKDLAQYFGRTSCLD